MNLYFILTCIVLSSFSTSSNGQVSNFGLKRILRPEYDTATVLCPDGRSECFSGSTCCKLSTGQYGCCPHPNAVCCKDDKHCCPHNYKCNVQNSTCDMALDVQVQPIMLTDSVILNVGMVQCPDGHSACPDGNTCCKLASGAYGCCPQPKAVCCSDHVHCCPQGYSCNVGSGTCLKQDSLSVVPWMEKQEAVAYNVGMVQCPDGRSACPDGNTCCKLASGAYGCCPQPKAVCCSDHVHCCPQGYSCNAGSGTCLKQDSLSVVPWMEKQEAVAYNVGMVQCPDGRSACPDGNTCCKLASGAYGCCPQPKAVCCSDHVHCCPQGYSCNVGSGTCLKQDSLSVVPWMEKQEAVAYNVGMVQCPDGRSACPDGNTCCKLASGAYGCCPQPKAVCCLDHVHCCPQGYSCNVGSGTCLKQDSLSVVPWMEKQDSVALNVGMVQCPDGRSACPDGNTCCKLASGAYGCCPQPKAVCCSDHVHCCPQGYSCNVGSGTCLKQDSLSVVPWMEKQEAVAYNVGMVQCPDGHSACPDGNTCCKLASGAYGCCPQPKAVCCSDHVHCCPQGYSCNVGSGTCLKQDSLSVVPWMEKQMSSLRMTLNQNKKLKLTKEKCTMCPDGSECPDYYTCCTLTSGRYGCCKFNSAVCCADHLHCCPYNTVCDTQRKVCLSRFGEIGFEPMVASTWSENEVTYNTDDESPIIL